VDVGYYAPAARTTLNPAVLIEFLSEIDLRLANPRVHNLWARAGAFRHPAVVCSTTTIFIFFFSDHQTILEIINYNRLKSTLQDQTTRVEQGHKAEIASWRPTKINKNPRKAKPKPTGTTTPAARGVGSDWSKPDMGGRGRTIVTKFLDQ